jgi:uncharacterized protein (TIGR03086 family)
MGDVVVVGARAVVDFPHAAANMVTVARAIVLHSDTLGRPSFTMLRLDDQYGDGVPRLASGPNQTTDCALSKGPGSGWERIAPSTGNRLLRQALGQDPDRYRHFECGRQARYVSTMTEIQDRYRLVSNGFDAAVRAATPGQWGAQSPCEQWTARDLVAHVVENHRGVIASVRGGESEPLGADEDPKRAWVSASRAIGEITGDPEEVAKEIDGPTGKMPAGQIIGQFVTMDVLVHTWDLARTIGADERLDEDSVRQAYEALKPMDAVIRQPNVFGPKLEPPPGADLQTEFLYFLGRRA